MEMQGHMPASVAKRPWNAAERPKLGISYLFIL